MDAILHPSIVSILLGIWGVVTLLLVMLMIYKSILENREDDQLFLDKAEDHLAREQKELVERLIQLDKPIMALGITSGALLLITAVVWVWRGLAENF